MIIHTRHCAIDTCDLTEALNECRQRPWGLHKLGGVLALMVGANVLKVQILPTDLCKTSSRHNLHESIQFNQTQASFL